MTCPGVGALSRRKGVRRLSLRGKPEEIPWRPIPSGMRSAMATHSCRAWLQVPGRAMILGALSYEGATAKAL